MNIFKIIDEIQKIDGDAVDRLEHATRRHFMNRIGSKLAAVAVPTVSLPLSTKLTRSQPVPLIS
jgi:hypothetical protein